MILCGGFATRLEPITLFVPKPLLPIGGKPILDHIFEDLEELDINRFILSTNRKFEDQFRYWAENKKAMGFKKEIEIIVEPSMHEGEKFGAIKGINYTVETAKIKDDLMIIAGDNFFSFDLLELVEKFRHGGHATIAVHDIKSKQEATRFGVVEMDDGFLKGFQEKPKEPKSTLISTGIYIIPKAMLAKFHNYINDKNNPDAPGYFIQWLINREKICGVIYSEDWYDIGTVDTYRKVFEKYIKV